MAFHLRKHRQFQPPTLLAGLFTALIGCGFSSQAADYTHKQFFDIGADRHPSVLQARNQVQAAGFDLASAQWARFPTVSSQPIKAPADVVFARPVEGVLLERAIAQSAQRKRHIPAQQLTALHD